MLGRFSKLLEKMRRKNGRKELWIRYVTKLYGYPIVRKIATIFYRSRKPKKMVFVLGCYNSGTTILRDMLRAHPAVGGMPREGVRLTSVFPAPEDYGWHRMTTRCPTGSMQPVMGKEAVAQLLVDWGPWIKQQDEIFLEKSISHAARLDWLIKVFPDAKYVVIYRNGYCSAEGIQRKGMAVGAASDELGSKHYPMEDCAREWNALNRNLLKFVDEGEDVLKLSYESLSAEPASSMRTVFEYLQLDPNCLSVTKGGALQIGKTEFLVSDMNWKSFERLNNKDISDINDVAGDLLTQLGYFCDCK